MQSLNPATSSRPFFTFLRKAFPTLKAILGVGLLAAALWGVDWRTVSSGFRAVRITWVAAGLISVLLTLVMKYLRWGILLQSEGTRLNWSRLWEAYFIGQAANILLPFRGGEVIRFSWAAAGVGSNAGILAASILLEKFLDLFGLTLLSTYLFLHQPALQMLNNPERLMLLTICAILLVSLFWVGPFLWESQKQRLQRWKLLRNPRLGIQMEQWMVYFRRLRQARSLVIILGMTLAIWVVMLATNVLVMNALDILPNFDSAAAVLGLIYVGNFPAFMPGNIGPFYFFASLGLTLYGVLSGPALTFAIVLHALVTLPSLAAAAWSLVFQSLRPAPTAGTPK